MVDREGAASKPGMNRLEKLNPRSLRRAAGVERGYLFRVVALFLVGCAFLPESDRSGSLRSISCVPFRLSRENRPATSSDLTSLFRHGAVHDRRCLLKGTIQN
jgi:hypothetical protein